MHARGYRGMVCFELCAFSQIKRVCCSLRCNRCLLFERNILLLPWQFGRMKGTKCFARFIRGRVMMSGVWHLLLKFVSLQLSCRRLGCSSTFGPSQGVHCVCVFLLEHCSRQASLLARCVVEIDH